MATLDSTVSPAPYFKVKPGHQAEFRNLCNRLVEETRKESGALYCGFCFDGDSVFAREAYENADAWLAHLKSVGELFGEMLKFADLTRLEIHSSEQELVKVRAALASMGMQAQLFTLEYGFRRDELMLNH